MVYEVSRFQKHVFRSRGTFEPDVKFPAGFPSNRMPPAADVTDVKNSEAELIRHIVSFMI